MKRSTWIPLFACAASAVLLPACSSGGGGGGPAPVLVEAEPNDASGDALALALNRYGTGEVATPTDVDYWAVALSGGALVRVELFATRLDQAGWDANFNVPRLTLWDTDGTSKLLEHDYGGFTSNGWSHGAHDLDMPLFRVPASGTYFVSITQDDQILTGGEYAVRVANVNLGSLQTEDEATGATGDNDTAATAEAIQPGTVHGFHVDDESDYYSFTVSGPSIVRFELTTYRNGVFGGDDSYFDTWLSLYDTDGTTVLFDNDDSFFYDSAIHYRFETAGTYFVEVTECCDDGDAEYFLSYSITSVGSASESEPNDTPETADSLAYGGRVTGTTATLEPDFYAFSGTAGDMIRLQFFDLDNQEGSLEDIDVELIGPDGTTPLSFDNGDELQTYTTILQETGTFYVSVNAIVVVLGGEPTIVDYTLELSRFRSSKYESEPNNTFETADTLDGQKRGSGVIDLVALGSEADFFRFNASQNRLTTIAIYADNSPTGSDGFENYSGHGSDLAPVLEVFDGDGASIALSTSNPVSGIYTEGVVDGLPTAAVSFVAPASGTYFVSVVDDSGSTGDSYFYVIEVK